MKSTLSNEDKLLIQKCKKERERLKKQAIELGDIALAKKFEVSVSTIKRV